MWKTLLLTAAVLGAMHTSVEATAIAGGPCETSGLEIDGTFVGERDVDYDDVPHDVLNGMGEHQRVLGIDPGGKHWPECQSGQHSWACWGEGWFCQCVRFGADDWHCGCETGQC